jgi:minor histocompatibility antigen H13
MANVTKPGRFGEILGHVAYTFNLVQPYLKTELHTVLAALFPIVIGAHASLTRPPSAAKPQKRRRSKTDGQHEDDEESEEEEDTFQRMEGFSRSDALFLPLYAGATLTGLYFLIKYLKDLNMLNMVLNYYFSSVGVFSVCKLLADGLQLVASLVFPKFYLGSEGIWQVNSVKKETINISTHGKEVIPRATPLPGLLAHLHLPATALWKIRQVLADKLTFKFYIHRIAAARVHVSPLGIVGTILGLAATAYYNFVEKTWWLTNLMGFAFSYTALQLISPTTFDTGSLILGALFVYDVVMVFYTPMMVTVAKNLDVPIKLLIPRESDKEGVAQFSMLGLGDVVLPGMMIALALRFDLYLHYLRLQKTVTTNEDEKKVVEIIKAPYVAPSKHWANQFWTQSWFGASKALPEAVITGTFKKTYFWTSVVGYIVGMITTLCVMITFQHPQPALLYLVPGVLISLWGMALIKGDVKVMYEYTEAEDEPSSEQNDKDPKNEQNHNGSGSFFSSSKVERNSKKLDKAISRLVEHGDTTDEEGGDEDKKEKSKKNVEATEKKLRKDTGGDLFYFSVSWYKPKSKKKEMTNWASTEKVDGEFDEHGRKRQRTA